MKLNRTEIADMLDVSMPTITAWMGEGMPYVEGGGKGKPFVFDSAECIEWWAENKRRRQSRSITVNTDAGDGPESYEEAERRKMVANADKAELELAKAAGLVVPIDEVAAVVAEENARVRARLLSIPNEVRMKVRSFFGGDRKLEEAVVGGVETTILDAMMQIREPSEMAEGLVGEG